MPCRFLVLGGVLVALAACESGPFSGSSTEPAAYGSPAAAESAYEGCASGERADLLHQNRPGGSDYNSVRCRSEGY